MYTNIPITTTAKQWKQQLQFELQGADYNTVLIFHSHEDVPILPFYTSDNKSISYNVEANPKAIISLYCSNIAQTLTRIEFWQTKGVQHFVITLHSEENKWETLFDQLPKENLYLIHTERFTELALQKISAFIQKTDSRIFLCNDYIHSFLKKGKWLYNQYTDLGLVVKTFPNKNHTILIDTTLYQNAGAGIVQQIAYGIAHTTAYLTKIENHLHSKITVYFKIAVGSNFLYETAKLRAFRQVAESVFEVFPFPIQLILIATPSIRELSISKTVYNQNYIALAYESAVMGGADFILPQNDCIYKKNTVENEIKHLQLIQEISQNRNASYLNKTYCFETIAYEIARKSLLLFQQIEKSGGLLEQAKNYSLQKKIKEQATQEQAYFEEQIANIKRDFEPFANEQEWELYPFAKQKHEKTQIEPLITKRLWENIEKK
ncbi:MAG: methylmalonyl-CoA mutase family protein [Capnocytophaga sp.]|nr:methylmalonyl-CoA mutase family protein [Capnocytophaga sp.]